MGTNSFIEDSGQFHKVMFKDADRLRLPRHRPVALLQAFHGSGGHSWAPGPEGLPGMLLSSGDPKGPEPQGSSCSRPFSEAFLRGGQITAKLSRLDLIMMYYPSNLDTPLNASNTKLMNKTWSLFRILPDGACGQVGEGWLYEI